MSTTTQILFNSPALHSLKRDQLVKLCKIHSLKASGKNNQLIKRLKLHAKTLPPDDPLSTATRTDNLDAKLAPDSEDEASDCSREGSASISDTLSRPGEQWEVVMDTIAEVDEETLRSNRGASDHRVDEFGTTTSKASITSSLRAIANSLGLKRNLSKTNSTISSPYHLSSRETDRLSSTLLNSDSNGGPPESPVEPIPGQSNLQGLPAPSAARLSLSQAPATTTIRLVSNASGNPEVLLSPPKLKPFDTLFDLVPATPGGTGSSLPVWPCSPGGAARESLYPNIPTFQGFGDLHTQQLPGSAPYDNSDMDLDVDMPGGLMVPSIREPTPEKARARLNTGATPKSNEKPSAEPIDIFSPAPKPHNASARSKLGIPRSEPFVFGSPLSQHNMSNLQFRTAAQSVLDEMNKRLAEEGVETVDTNVLSSRRTITEELVKKQEGNGHTRVGDMFNKIHQKEFDKMDSITSHYAAKRGTQNTAPQPILSKKRKSSLVVKERSSGVQAARHRPNGSRIASAASVRVLPDTFSEEGDEDEDVADRRMSKRPRVERGELDAPIQSGGTSVTPQPDAEEEARKQKEREAIRRRLEHSKAKRRSSMGRPGLGHASSPKPKPARSGFFASAKSLVQNVWNRGAGSKAMKLAVVSSSSDVPPVNSQRKRVAPSSNNTTLALPNAPGRFAPPMTSLKSPAPPSNLPSSSSAMRTSTVAGYGQSHNKGSSLIGFSSLGRKTVHTGNDTRVASMGAKSNIATSPVNLARHATGIPRLRTLSTLMAPTASSLAKTNSSRVPVSTTHNENSTLTRAASSKQRFAMSPQPNPALDQITNSSRSPALSPRPGKIFGQPPGPPSMNPPMSLATAATCIVGPSAQEKSTPRVKPPLPLKPKVLPGRRPRISRSKVIAKLASQRAAGASSSMGSGTQRPAGKVRSSMGAGAAGRMQLYGGARGGEVLMSAKKRVRQSEHTRRKSRAIADEGRMDVD